MPVGRVEGLPRTEGALALAPDPIPEPSNISPFAPPAVKIASDTDPKAQTSAPAVAIATPLVTPQASSGDNWDPSWDSVVPDAGNDIAPPDPEATQPSADAPAGEAAQFQAAAVEALFETKKHNSAAEQLEETTWTISSGEVQIATTLSKALMGTIFRPDVEAIIKTALREKGLAGVRLVFIPATPNSKPKEAKKPRTGSAQAKALEHPTVQQAQKLFNAEVTNVFDLRKD
jgi:DNA polymerase-3 subunit gamma/tau